MQLWLSRQEIWSCAALFLILLGLALWPRGTRKGAAGSQERQPCSPAQAKKYLAVIRDLAEQERFRRWKDHTLESRQAAWLVAKAEYALEQAKCIGKGDQKKETQALFLVEDTCQMLLRAAAQSRLGCPVIQEEKGARLRAYCSPIDQSFQTYSISVPAAYDPAVSWPLLVSMHGHGWYRPFQGHPAPAYSGAFCLSPQGRGATDYKDLGEEDVLQAIAEVMQDFNIDPNRVYLTGSSMGGTGSLHLGVHYADRFAAIFATVGNADNQAWTKRWGWNRIFPGRNNQLRDWLQDAHTARAFAGNLRNLPVYLLSGAGDTVVPPEHSRNMAAELRQKNCTVEYREFPGVGHGGFPADASNSGLSWACGWSRDPYPHKISWRAALLKHGRAYWLRLLQFSKPLAYGEIEAEIYAPNRVRIVTGNLRAFALQRSPKLFNPERPLFLEINGERVIMAPYRGPEDNWHILRFDDIHGWDWECNRITPPLQKTAGCEGPVQEAILAPFIVVVATQSQDPAINAAWMHEARTFTFEWQRRNNAPCLMVKDVDCTMEMLENRNIVLFGGVEDNSISAVLDDAIPWREILAPLNGTDLQADDIGTILVYPVGNLSPGKLQVQLSANSPHAIWQIWSIFGNWFNWGVYDSKKYFDYAVFDARSASPETMLLTGWFGTDWSVGKGVSYLGEPVLREEFAPQRFPRFADGKAVPEDMAELYLCDLRPAKIDQMRGAVGWGRSFNGENTGDKDLGLRAPTTLEFPVRKKFNRFCSEVSLHNPLETSLCQMRSRGEKVKFTVLGDGQKLAEATVDWREPVAKLEAVITGVDILRLVASPAGGPSWLHSGALWKNPRLLRDLQP